MDGGMMNTVNEYIGTEVGDVVVTDAALSENYNINDNAHEIHLRISLGEINRVQEGYGYLDSSNLRHFHVRVCIGKASDLADALRSMADAIDPLGGNNGN